MSETEYPVYTIGHSNHAPQAFLSLLRKHSIDEVIDVRSSPYSRYTPQFNHNALEMALEAVGIEYTFLGGELGGRPADRSCYDADGRVLYDRLAETESFQDGISYVTRHADEYRAALMCSEKDPLDCHRALLIAGTLLDRGVAVEHILSDGALETHTAAMDRLMDDLKLPPNGDLFRSRDEVIADALTRRARKVAYAGGSPPHATGDAGVWEQTP